MNDDDLACVVCGTPKREWARPKGHRSHCRRRYLCSSKCEGQHRRNIKKAEREAPLDPNGVWQHLHYKPALRVEWW